MPFLDTLEEIFAQNSLSKCIIQDIILLVAKSWVKDTLGPSLKKFMNMKKNLAPDPRTNAMSEETRTKLGEIMKECVSDLLKSVDSMPFELKRILVFAKKKLDRKWPPGSGPAARPLVNLIIFLFAHVVIPATAQPQIWGISKEMHSSESGRTSIVLNKVFRNIANGTAFDSTSPLAAYNVTIKKLQPKLESFAETIWGEIAKFETSPAAASSTTSLTSSGSQTHNLPPLKPMEPQSAEVVHAAFSVLHHCMYLWKDAILEYRNSLFGVPASESRIYFDLIGILEELELIEGKPECIQDFTILSLDKTTKPPSKATMRKPTPNQVVGASSSNAKGAPGSPSKPYVRQLSEKWNREHQQMLAEATKRTQAAEQRKADRESRGKSTSLAPAMVKSTPSSPAKPKSRASVSEDTSRTIIKRSHTSDPPKHDAVVEPSSDHSESTLLTSSGSNTRLTFASVPEGKEPETTPVDSPVSADTISSRQLSAQRGLDTKSTASAEMELDTASAAAVQSASPAPFTPGSSPDVEGTTTSAPNSATTSPAVGRATKGEKTTSGSSSETSTPKPLLRSTSSAGKLVVDTYGTDKNGRPPKIKDRKSKKFPVGGSSSALLEGGMSDAGSSRGGSDSSSSELVSPNSKRRKKADSRSPSAAPVIESPKTKVRRRTKESTSDDEVLVAVGGGPKKSVTPSVPSVTAAQCDLSSLDLASQPKEAAAVPTVATSTGGAGTKSPKLTIVSLHPNPMLNNLENTPVTPRTAEFLRERSNSTSDGGRYSPPKPKKEKALEMLGIQASGGTITEVGTSSGMASVVRELGVANAKLQRELEAAKAKAAQLEIDIVRLREHHESRANKISEFHSKLTSSILYKRTKAAHLRRLTLHCKRTWIPSIDDNLWEFQAASQHDRRAVLASTIFSRAKDTNSSYRMSSSSSTQSIKSFKKNTSAKVSIHSLEQKSSDSDSESPQSRSGSIAASLDRSSGLQSSEAH